MRALLFLLPLALLPALAACDSSDGESAAVRYDIVLNEAGEVAAIGSLTFATPPAPGAAVDGQYTLNAAEGGPLDPLTTTSGSFSSTFEGDSLVVRIEAPVSDAGLRLAGPVSSSSYSGNWSEVTIAGPQLRGTFVGEP